MTGPAGGGNSSGKAREGGGRIRVSFDFDETLSRRDVQRFAGELILGGIDVYIITSRLDERTLRREFGASFSNADLREVAGSLRIPKHKIIYTNAESKYHFIRDAGDLVFHLDDDPSELKLIREFTGTRAVSCCGNPGWRQECLGILEEKGIAV